MHALAITHDNKILSWGVNDSGALGRDTTWDGGLKDMDAADSDSEDENDNGTNPTESNPAEVDWSTTDVPQGTRWVDVAAGDSCSFALTDDGHVYGWGTFRATEGVFGFTEFGNTVYRPVLVPNLSKITSIATGANFALALDTTGAVYAWGSGEQCQLGRRLIVRNRREGLTPKQFGLPKGPKNGIAAIACGNDHGFALSKNGTLYSWGNNSFGATGIKENAGLDNAIVCPAQPLKSLKGKHITAMNGGTHHSIACTQEGECITWGRADVSATGHSKEELAKLPDDSLIYDTRGKPRILIQPTSVSHIDGQVSTVAAAGDQCIVTTTQGKAYAWGFSENYQTGLGVTEEQETPKLMSNKAVDGKFINGAHCGAQYGFLTERVPKKAEA